MDQALDSLFQLNERPKVHELGHGALDLRTNGEFLRHVEPGVGEGLLQAEGNPALLGLDGENDGVDPVALLENVAGVAELFAIGHFGNMNEAFHAGFNLNKSPEVGEPCDGSGDALAGDEALGRLFPGFGLELLEAEGDFPGFGVDFEDFDLELLAGCQDIFWLGDAAVGDVADVEQTVDSAKIHKCAIRHEAADCAADNVAFLHGFVLALLQGAGLLFKDDAAIHYDVFVGDIELGDAAGDFSADQFFKLDGVAGSAAAGGHEGADANVHVEAAFNDFSHGADHGHLFSESGFQGRPVAGLRHFKAGKLVVVLFVAAGYGDGEGVAEFDGFGIVVKGGARQNAFGFVADVEEDLIGGDGHDGALQLLCAGVGLVRVGLLKGGEQVGEGLRGFFTGVVCDCGGFWKAIVCHDCLPFHSPTIERRWLETGLIGFLVSSLCAGKNAQGCGIISLTA